MAHRRPSLLRHVVIPVEQRSFINVAQAAHAFIRLACGDANVDAGVCNLVEHTRSINDIADALSKIHDGLERLRVQPNLQGRSLRVLRDPALEGLTGLRSDFVEDIRNLDAHFAFSCGSDGGPRGGHAPESMIPNRA